MYQLNSEVIRNPVIDEKMRKETADEKSRGAIVNHSYMLSVSKQIFSLVIILKYTFSKF